MAIHSTAIIHPTAKIADNASIGPWTVVGEEVEIGEHTVIGPHVVIGGLTRIGKHNRIFQFASVGEDPQDKKYQGERTFLEIGDSNVIRECCTIHRGTAQDRGTTTIGSHNLFMAYVHVAHDCVVGNHCIFSNNASIAGHVEVGDHAILAGFSGVHQFCMVGTHSFLGMGTRISQDLPPFFMVSGGDTPKPYGLNAEGLKRRGFDAEVLQVLKRAYKTIYRSGLTMDEIKDELAVLVDEASEVRLLMDFILRSKRGIVR